MQGVCDCTIEDSHLERIVCRYPHTRNLTSQSPYIPQCSGSSKFVPQSGGARGQKVRVELDDPWHLQS